MRIVGMLLLVAACGRFGFDPRTGDDGADDDGGIDAPPPAYVPNWKSGTRIKARVLRSPDGGDPMWAGWFDTLLDTPCASQVAADGVERCLPNELRLGGEFSDSSCTVPVALAFDAVCGGPDRYAWEFDVVDLVHVFALGPVVGGQVYTTDTGPCTATGVSSNVTVYALGAEIPASMFIATRYMNLVIGNYDRVKQGFADGSEILNVVLGLPSIGRFCTPEAGGFGDLACHEVLPALTPVYQDAGCSLPAYLAGGVFGDSSFYVNEPSLCGNEASRFARGADVTTAIHWVKDPGGACTSHATAGGAMYLATPEIDPFPRGTVAAGPRRGRIGKLFWTAPDGDPFELSTYDHALGVPCRPFRATDGKLRCLPSQPRKTMGFASATCGGTASQLTGACYAGTPVFGPNYPACRDQAWPVKGLTSVGGAASAYVEDSCRPLPVPSQGTYDASQLTTEVPPGTFAELVETIE